MGGAARAKGAGEPVKRLRIEMAETNLLARRNVGPGISADIRLVIDTLVPGCFEIHVKPSMLVSNFP